MVDRVVRGGGAAGRPAGDVDRALDAERAEQRVACRRPSRAGRGWRPSACARCRRSRACRGRSGGSGRARPAAGARRSGRSRGCRAAARRGSRPRARTRSGACAGGRCRRSASGSRAELLAQRGDLGAQLGDLALEPVEPVLARWRPARRRQAAGRPRAPRRPRRPAGARSGPRAGRAGARSAPPARAPSAGRRRACSAAESGKRCRRSVRWSSSPGVCGPRSIITASTACSSGPIWSASSSRWRNLAARLPW